ncbi:DUF3369 domain-containing protein [Aestuariispira insulae]|uniref:Response regulator RpfG family c-di-GMP phosphodiesterase n=1 Tax=Aestuariispira insulae TaxID=1461337 RepID=A0A3D9H7G0_9PROT|nr:DUF3369 domain-containing protein [Aestuariispira insulae]RED45091.1 response regulator RpfG family c-di-GMP phosphodiesterase [Aestuariispira insulae]
MTDDDFLYFAEDEADEMHPVSKSAQSWKILVVDDEPEVHRVTKLALDSFTFAGRPLQFFNAESAIEAKEILNQHKDLAMVLLDVVMETDHAGLELAKWIREDLKNHFIRIILRTGQPGQAPETEVIANYDINDYKEKTELTSRKLFTLMYSTLRSYRDIMAIDRNRQGLEKIIDASATLFELQSLQKFTRGALEQLSALLHLNEGAVYGIEDGLALSTRGDEIIIQAGTGKFSDCVGCKLREVMEPDQVSMLIHYMKQGKNVLTDKYYVGIYPTHTGGKNLLYLSGLENVEEVNEHLIEVFGRNIGVAFENLYLLRQIEENERTMVTSLGTMIEGRASKSGDMSRIADVVRFLAKKLDLGEQTVEILARAAPLHDIGMLTVPEEIINKPGDLTEEERIAIRKHPEVGYGILSQSKQDTLRAAALIARDHHERWDGHGYPAGKHGDNIHIYARLTAIADVFDALLCPRVYKKNWNIDEIKNYFRQQRGKQFDPDLTDLLLAHADELAAFYPDRPE